MWDGDTHVFSEGFNSATTVQGLHRGRRRLSLARRGYLGRAVREGGRAWPFGNDVLGAPSRVTKAGPCSAGDGGGERGFHFPIRWPGAYWTSWLETVNGIVYTCGTATV
jgi:hypothetical protein